MKVSAISAASAKDVAERRAALDDRTAADRSRHASMAHLQALALARLLDAIARNEAAARAMLRPDSALLHAWVRRGAA